MESKALLSSLTPNLPTRIHESLAPERASPIDSHEVVHFARIHHEKMDTASQLDSALLFARRVLAIPKPPFERGAIFSVSGRNFPANFISEPAMTDGEQNVTGPLMLTMGAIESAGLRWIELDFHTSAGTLAGDNAMPWRAGPISGIKLNTHVFLKNSFFFFTVDGHPVTRSLGHIPGDIYAGANPISTMPSVPQVFFSSKFSERSASGTLNLGTIVSSGSLTYAHFLHRLRVPLDANGLSLFVLANPE
jgi:hypothetical protein